MGKYNEYIVGKNPHTLYRTILDLGVCEICGEADAFGAYYIDGNLSNKDSSNILHICKACEKTQRRTKCIICGAYGHIRKKYCNLHYIRYRKYGNPIEIRQWENLEGITCPKCRNIDKQILYGFTKKGTRRYRCMECKATHTNNPTSIPARGD